MDSLFYLRRLDDFDDAPCPDVLYALKRAINPQLGKRFRSFERIIGRQMGGAIYIDLEAQAAVGVELRRR